MRKSLQFLFLCLSLSLLSGCEKVTLGSEGGEDGNASGSIPADPPSSGIDTLYSDVEPVEGSVRGYIVGSCQRSIKNADFEAPFEGHTALLLADRRDEREKVVAIHLKTGAMRSALNLEDHPENQGKTLRVRGKQGSYLGTVGMNEENITGEYELLE